MCGIFSFISKSKISQKDILLGRNGTKFLYHRGPNGSGEWINKKKGIYIGHRRLKIIDLSNKASQPMVKKDTVLSYNGEIYNFKEIRENLKKKGYKFFSTSDTEVLLNLWMDKGPSCLNEIDGMFSFIIWDGKNIWIARDKFGEKQLFYAIVDNGIFISSEIQPLIKITKLEKNLNEKKVSAFLSLGYIPSPSTGYKNIYSLEPSTLIKINKGKIVNKIKYWKQSNLNNLNKKEINKKFIDNFQETLIDSVKSRITSDAKRCLFLSSGVDSSLIASIISKDLNIKIPCISVSFEKQYNEINKAKAIAKYLNLPHYTSNFSKKKINSNLLNKLYGQPNDNLTIISVIKMCSLAQKLNFKVGITGMGGDEISQGYLKQLFIHKYKFLYGLPEKIRKLIYILIYPLLNSKKRFLYKNIFGIDDKYLYIALKNIPIFTYLLSLKGFDVWCSKTFKKFNNKNFYKRVCEFDIESVMADSRLACFDLGGMNKSIELRSPLLNHKLFSLYNSLKLNNLNKFGQKYVLREVLKRYLPDKLITKNKKGFVYPASYFSLNTKKNSENYYLTKNSKILNLKNEYSWRKINIRKDILNNFVNH